MAASPAGHGPVPPAHHPVAERSQPPMDLSQRAHLYTLLKDYAEDFEGMTRNR